MINMLYILHEQYRNREIYIWDVNRDAVTIFKLLAFRKINIAGFVSYRDKYVSQTFVNRKIVGLEYLKNKTNVLVIVSDDCDLNDAELKNLSAYVEVLPYSRTLSLNEKLRNGQVTIYGTGKGAEALYQELYDENISIDCFCVSKRGEEQGFHGRPVFAFDDISKDKDKPIVIAVQKDNYKIQILKNLINADMENIFIDDITDIYLDQEVFFPAINRALIEHKKIFIYGFRDCISELLEEVFSIYQIPIEGYVSDEGSVDDHIESVYDLCYLELSEIFVVITEIEWLKLQCMCEKLDEVGLALEDFNYTALRRTTIDYRNPTVYAIDPLVGAGVLVNENIPGYFVYGNHCVNDFKIMVLGGSTSADGTHRPKCWSRYLHEKLVKEGYSVTIYNGAYVGHDVVQALLRLLRDGSVIQPDLVISMSGVNNTVFKERMKNQFNVEYHLEWIKALDRKCEIISGLKSDEKLCDFWFRIERIMEAVSKIYNAKFYGFLQPMQFAKKDKNLFECNVFESEKRKKPVRQFRECADDMSGIINLISRFDKEQGMFIDFCHYSDKAQKMLADIVYDHIIDEIINLDRRDKSHEK